MTSTWFQVPASEAQRLTDNYGILGGNAFPIDPGPASIFLDAPSVKNGGGGLVSSPKDYDRFLRMLLGYGRIDGKFVMSEEAVRVGTSNLIPATVDLTGSWIAGEGHGAGGRSKGTTFGWGGAAGTLAAVDFGLGLRSCLWTQYMPSEAIRSATNSSPRSRKTSPRCARPRRWRDARPRAAIAADGLRRIAAGPRRPYPGR